MRRTTVSMVLAMMLGTALGGLPHMIKARASASNANSLLLAQGRGTVSINDASLEEGDAGTSNITLIVTVTGSHTNTIGVDYTTANGSATAPSDYISTSGQLVFDPSGEPSVSILITVPIVGDTVLEQGETFFVNLTIVDSSGDLADGQGVGTIIDNDGACSVSILQNPPPFGREGGTGSILVTAPAACNWTAVSNDSWITVTSGATGSGDGAVNYSVAANTGDFRRGTITIAGQTFTILQNSCVLGISFFNQVFPPSGGMGSITVRAATDCNWTAVSNDSWINITSGATGSGDRTVTYSVAPHMGAVRHGLISIAGTLVSVTQEGAENCVPSISPTQQSVPHDPDHLNGDGRVMITLPAGCIWAAMSNDSWIRITSNESGIGDSTLTYRTERNTGPARTGTITIGGQTFTVHQERCPVRLEPTRQEFSYVGGTGELSVYGGCRPTPVSNAGWISITDFFSDGIRYRVAENPGAFRTGTITIGDVTFEVAQFTQGSCSILIDPASDTFYASGAKDIVRNSGQISVGAPPGCKWTARSNTSWVNLREGASGSGDGLIHYSVAPNLTGHPRSGTIDVRDESLTLQHAFTVNQRGALPPCVEAISPETLSLDGNLEHGSIRMGVRVTAPPGCIWDAIPHAPWLAGVADTGSGDGVLFYTVDDNPGGVRSSIIDIGGKIHTVTQNVGNCPVETICQVLPSQCEQQASEARSFRDKVLAHTPRGQRYTELYYKFSTEAVGIIVFNPMLILRSREMMQRYMPVVQSMVRGEEVTLTEGDIEEIDGFLRSFAEKGSPELKETVREVCQDLRETQVQLEFNITITTGQKRALPSRNAARIISRTGIIAAPLGIFLFCFYRLSPGRRKALKTPLKRLLCLAMVFWVGGSQMSIAAGQGRRTRAPLTLSNQAKYKASSTNTLYGELPLRFEANRDQLDSQVRFFSRGSRCNFYLTPTEAVMMIRNQESEVRGQMKMPLKLAKGEGLRTTASDRPMFTDLLRMKFIGANPDTPLRGIDELPGRTNYFTGDRAKWRSDIPSCARVEYENIYRGIDLVYYGKQGELEYDFNVAPGADPAAIRIGFEGADKIGIDSAGELVMSFASGEVRQRKPVAYQEADGMRRPVSCQYRLRDRVVELDVGTYDRSRPLIIDPVLSYSTYFGGSGNEEGNSIAVDSAGNVYITGFTDSIDFPLANGSQPVIGGGQQDAFVAKLDPSGTRLLYSTYIGGNGQDNATSIAVDSAGNAYVTGFTDSTNFPVRNALQSTKKGSFNAFVVKLDAAGSMLDSTLFGGGSSDYGSSIVVDSAGSLYFAGLATSNDVPTTSPLQPAHGGLVDIFVAKMDSSGLRLVYSTYLGGSGIEGASSIAVDSAGNLYLTGLTGSRDFPTVNPLQATNGGGVFDAFVTKLNPSGTQILYSTYLGGGGEDRAFRIAVDSSGSAYLTGDTDSADFPLANALQRSNGGSADAFVAKLNPPGNQLVYSTYLGGSGIDGGTAISVDSAGSAYVTGFTASANFPTANPLQPNPGGAYDGFVTKLSSSGSALDYSTYLGGSGVDSAFGVASDSAGNAFVMGLTASTNFPTVTPLQPMNGGGTADIFIAKIRSGLQVTGASVSGKNLLVRGSGFDQGARILLNGQQQKTTNDGQNPATSLVGKKAGKKIARGETVTLQVRNSDGTLSNEFTLTRPVQ